jgi:hypothetical protein
MYQSIMRESEVERLEASAIDKKIIHRTTKLYHFPETQALATR